MDDTREYLNLSNLPLRNRLENISKEANLRLDVIQQDYILTWILSGLFEHPLLKAELIFKGGTALKKCYFGNYRFSEDLDFTAPPYLPKGELLLGAINKACMDTEQKMQQFAPMRLFVEEYKEKDSHPHQQEAFKIKAQFPWQREPLTTIMIEISRDEILLYPPISRPILQVYGEAIETSVVCYSLEEIVLEKLRDILQHTKKLHEREWSRSRVRDYYDLWSIFKFFGSILSFQDFSADLQKKCKSKEVGFNNIDSFFDPEMIRQVEKTWNRWLGPLVFELPDHRVVVEELRTTLGLMIDQTTIPK